MAANATTIDPRPGHRPRRPRPPAAARVVHVADRPASTWSAPPTSPRRARSRSRRTTTRSTRSARSRAISSRWRFRTSDVVDRPPMTYEEQKRAWEAKVQGARGQGQAARRASRTSRATPTSRRSTAPTISRSFDPATRPRLPRHAALHARRAAEHVPRPLLDDAPVRRLRHRRRVERALPLPARAGSDRALASPSICPRRWAATPTTRAASARSAASASPSTRSTTCARSSAGLPLDKISTSMTINATASTLLCLYIAVAEEQGVPRDKLRGTIQNDILKEYMARGTYIYPPRPSLRLITDIFAFCGKRGARSGTRSRSAATTSARRAATRCRRWRSRSPTASRT